MAAFGAQQAFSRGGARVSNAPIPDLPALALETGQQEAKVPPHMRRIGLSPIPVNFHSMSETTCKP
jgi:hypothetical protein